MSPKNAYRQTIKLLVLGALVLMAWKAWSGYWQPSQFLPQSEYSVSFDYSIDSAQTEEALFVKTYLPTSNQHQTITSARVQSANFTFTQDRDETNVLGEWRGAARMPKQLHYDFNYQGRALRYHLSRQIAHPQLIPDSIKSFLEPSEYIQSDDPIVKALAADLSTDETKTDQVLKHFFEYVSDIPATQTSELTDALMTIERQEASCNGKSRLLTALCRASGIPARPVGGLILENIQKRTSHLWMEAWVGGSWIPFDALNGHFAYLPAHYMELYRGDEFLIRRSPAMAFDYAFTIERSSRYDVASAHSLSLWNLLQVGQMPVDALKVILLLPLCALVVALFRNVIGLKTIGVFLPAIIAVSLDGVGLWYGMLAYLLVVGCVGLLHFPMERWGILHTPKLVIMLTAVVLSLLLLSSFGWATGQPLFSMAIGFPIIVLTIAAEKFARTILEEGFADAVKLQFQTLILTLACYLVYQADFLLGFLLSFPETYLLVLALLLILGRWIGLRLNEFIRFRQLAP